MTSISRMLGHHNPLQASKAPVKEKDYLSFIHKLPCIITGIYGIEAAHLSTHSKKYGHTGRGGARKASDRWVLPLTKQWHDKQHSMNEMAFWQQNNINPHVLCLALHGVFKEYGDCIEAEQLCLEVIELHRGF